MADDVFGINFPNEASNLLFDLPVPIDEEGRDDGRYENTAQNASGDLRISQTVVRIGAFLVPVAARRLVQRYVCANPRNLVR